LDGSEQTVVLAGTGKETSDMALLPNVEHPELLALVSGREGGKTIYNSPRIDLFVFNTTTKALKKVAEGTNAYQFRGWLGDTLIYRLDQISAGVSCGVLKSYNVGTQKTSSLHNCNVNQNVVVNSLYDNTVLYSIFPDNQPEARGVYAVRSDGNNERRLTTTAGSVYRQAKESILAGYYYANTSTWNEINLETLKVTKLDNAPTFEQYRAYVDSPNEQLSCFIETRDGTSNLYLTNEAGENERKLTTKGANQFVQWYHNRYIVYAKANELYAVSINAKENQEPVKIADFFNSGYNVGYGGGYNPNSY
jgi:transcription elongation factor Elf1